MTKRKGAQQDSAKNDTAAESPAEQKTTTSGVPVLQAVPEPLSKPGFQPADEDLVLPEGDSDESPEKDKGDNETQESKPKPKTGADLYPEGTKLFKYQPKGTKDADQSLFFPMEFEKPNKIWLWELNQLPFLNQTWAWMDRANVPKAIQRQAVSLPDDEYPDAFNAWFEAMGGGATAGE